MIYPFLCAHPESASVAVHVLDIGNVDEMRRRWPDGEPLFVVDRAGTPLENVSADGAEVKLVTEMTLRKYCGLFRMELAC